MDVSPQLLREVEFREQWRGYNPDEVDDFLERVATALEQLQDRLRETADRAARAERQAAEGGGGGEDELRRTLVLAQRTADAAVQEATEEAARLRAEAEEQAGSLLAEARSQAEALVAEAEERAAVELGQLTERRQELEADVEALTSYVDEHRHRLADDLRAQLEWLEDPERLALRERPELRGTPVAPPEREAEAEVGEESLFAEEPAGEPLPGSEELADALRTFEGNGGNGQGAAAPWRLPPEEPAEPEDSALDGAAADDPFLAELRRAVIDPEPLGPRHGDDDEDEDGEVFDQDMASARFRRRRRR